MRWLVGVLAVVVGCGGSSKAKPDGGPGGSDATGGDAVSTDASGGGGGLGMVTGTTPGACPGGAPPGSTCQRVTIAGCPGIEGEEIAVTLAVLPTTATRKGTIVHFKGAGGEGWEVIGAAEYRTGGFEQVFVSWSTDWEQTTAAGIKTAACRPATLLKWIYDQPTLHGGSHALAYCGQGFSGGSGQLGYALATYGIGAYLDYVNELSGPPFARIDLGCDFSQPQTAQVCGAADTTRLPAANLNTWENTTTCGSMTPSSAEVTKWMNDSISIGGTYAFPNTMVQFFDCTYRSSAVTAMAQIFYQQIMAAEGGSSLVDYHCYTQADGCQGESLGTGANDAIAAMLAGCTMRH